MGKHADTLQAYVYKRRPTNWRYLVVLAFMSGTELLNAGMKCDRRTDWLSSIGFHKTLVCLSRNWRSVAIADAPHSPDTAFETHKEHCGCNETK